jgi:hypothetical protein
MLVFSATAVGAASLGGYASAQTSLKAQLVGSWTFVSGGSTDQSGRPVWGEGAKGLLIFLENGRYSSQLMRADLPKFGSGSRLQGSPEENKAVVQGSVSSFGTYTVHEDKKAFTIKWEAHTFPNLTGQSQTRSFAITGEELRIQNPGPLPAAHLRNSCTGATSSPSPVPGAALGSKPRTTVIAKTLSLNRSKTALQKTVIDGVTSGHSRTSGGSHHDRAFSRM